MRWDGTHIKRVLLDFALKVTDTPFYGTNTLYDKTGCSWKDDVGLDSIQMMHLWAEASSFFNLLELDKPPYLLQYNGVDEWVDSILVARKQNDSALNFKSSGTTGTTRITKHTVASLDREIQFLSSLFKDVIQVIPYIPSYTIYGFLFTIGLQQQLNIPIIYPSEIPSQLPDSLVVATPFHWHLILTASSANLNCYGVSSGAPLYDTVFKSIIDRNVILTELYGSTETAGVAHRQHYLQDFTLFPYWHLAGSESDSSIEDEVTRMRYPLMDQIVLTGPRTFNLSGRKDQKINIAGKLTDLRYIENTISQLPNITRCKLSAKRIDNDVILFAHLTLDIDTEDNRAAAISQIRLSLKPHEVPKRINFE